LQQCINNVTLKAQITLAAILRLRLAPCFAAEYASPNVGDTHTSAPLARRLSATCFA